MPTQVQHQNQFVFSRHIKQQISSVPSCSRIILERGGFRGCTGHNIYLYKAAHLILLRSRDVRAPDRTCQHSQHMENPRFSEAGLLYLM